MAVRIIYYKTVRVLYWNARVGHGECVQSPVIIFPIFIPKYHLKTCKQ
jgi:hypothetical protein